MAIGIPIDQQPLTQRARSLLITHGQLLFVLGHQFPWLNSAERNSSINETLKYLRRRGVPFDKSELGTGRGNRVYYYFEQIVDVCMATTLVTIMDISDVAWYLKEYKKELHDIYRSIAERPSDWTNVYKDDPLSSPVIHINMSRIGSSRSAIAPEVVTIKQLMEQVPVVDFFRPIVMIHRLVVMAVGNAEQAPLITPGPK